MLLKILNYIEKHNLINRNSTLIVGLSGGVDSVCLLHILHSISSKYNIKLVAAHLNHGWRTKEETDKDLQICQNLCNKLSIKLEVSSLEQTQEKISSKEAFAREARRVFFNYVLQKHSASNIALAHHQDDQIETFFIRLIRGSNISGLSSIKPRNGLYIRPLLQISKEELINYAKEHNLLYATDSTNTDDSYLRNSIRNNIIPKLINTDSRFINNTIKAINSIQETDNFISRLVSQFLEQNTKTEGDKLYLDINSLLSQDKYLQSHIILAWLIKSKAPIKANISSRYLEEIMRFLNGNSKVHNMGNFSISKEKNYIFI